MKRRIRCEEWARVGIGQGLELDSHQEVAAILGSWGRSTGKDPASYFEVGLSRLVPKFWSGVVETDDLVFEVSPIGSKQLSLEHRSRLDRQLSIMMETARLSNDQRGEFASVSLDGSRFDSLLTRFCDDLGLARRRQVIRRYCTSRESLPSPRGRVVFPAQCQEAIRRPGRFVSEWVHFSEDVPENRILKEVLVRYRPRCSSGVRGRIDRLLAELDPVSSLGTSVTHWGGLRWDRLPDGYRDLLRRSQMLLEGDVGAGIFAGSVFATGAIIFTSRLFEVFVGGELVAVARSLALNAIVQDRGTFACTDSAGDEAFELIPDVRIADSWGRTKVIVDTKWKRLEMHKPQMGISREDIHQILVYGLRFDCENLVLLFPDTTSVTGEVGYSTRLTSQLGDREFTINIVKVPLLGHGRYAIREALRALIGHVFVSSGSRMATSF